MGGCQCRSHGRSFRGGWGPPITSVRRRTRGHCRLAKIGPGPSPAGISARRQTARGARQSASETLGYVPGVGKRPQAVPAQGWPGTIEWADVLLSNAAKRLSAKSTRRKSAALLPPPDAGESRGAVALTVAWMLACTSTAVAMLVVVSLELLSLIVPFHGPQAHPLRVVAGMMLLVALATGALCLVFTPLAYRVRQAPPPPIIAIAAVLIGLSPVVVLIVLAVFT